MLNRPGSSPQNTPYNYKFFRIRNDPIHKFKGIRDELGMFTQVILAARNNNHSIDQKIHGKEFIL